MGRGAVKSSGTSQSGSPPLAGAYSRHRRRAPSITHRTSRAANHDLADLGSAACGSPRSVTIVTSRALQTTVNAVAGLIFLRVGVDRIVDLVARIF